MQSIRFLLVMALLTGLAYPVAVTVIVRLVFPKQSQGSLIVRDGQIVGSQLIAQPVKDPKLFWPRPSASDYIAVPGRASNLAPTNPNFPKDPNKTSSASGLDPDLSPEMLSSQLDRIATARNLSPKQKELLRSTIGHKALSVYEANNRLRNF